MTYCYTEASQCRPIVIQRLLSMTCCYKYRFLSMTYCYTEVSQCDISLYRGFSSAQV